MDENALRPEVQSYLGKERIKTDLRVSRKQGLGSITFSRLIRIFVIFFENSLTTPLKRIPEIQRHIVVCVFSIPGKMFKDQDLDPPILYILLFVQLCLPLV